VPTKHEKDDVTGIETTGHEWDGIKELNNPLPRWWLYILYLCILFAVIWWILFPAWPTLEGYTKGVLGWTRHEQLAEETTAARERQASYLNQIAALGVVEVAADPDLRAFAMAGGRSAFAVNCSQCHGTGAEGAPGYPNLNDDDWLWGGDVETIAATIRYGIRSGHDESRENEMPAFLTDELLTAAQIDDLAAHLLSYTEPASDVDAAARGGALFEEECSVCHGENGEGIAELGGPALNDHIWLYGGTQEEIVRTISRSRNGVMPAWDGRLDDTVIKQLAVFVHGLGGGE
jgi:cytochrome c oxidase cbb3-type subunit 3